MRDLELGHTFAAPAAGGQPGDPGPAEPPPPVTDPEEEPAPAGDPAIQDPTTPSEAPVVA